MENKALTKLRAFEDAFAAAKAKFLRDSGALIAQAFAELFTTLPATVNNFSWTQYTPYFNDGDTCEFQVNTDPDINGKEADYDSPERESIKNFLAYLNADVLYALYGDHAKITAYRDGRIKRKVYDHD